MVNNGAGIVIAVDSALRVGGRGGVDGNDKWGGLKDYVWSRRGK